MVGCLYPSNIPSVFPHSSHSFIFFHLFNYFLFNFLIIIY
jgi:hypothetical protein